MWDDCRSYPKNAAMQGTGARQLLEMLGHYEDPELIIRLMGTQTAVLIGRAIKMHHDSLVCLRSALPLFAELLTNEKNLKKVMKIGISEPVKVALKEFHFDETVQAAGSKVLAGLRGVHTPLETLEVAVKNNDCELAMLVMKWQPDRADVQDQGASAIAQIVKSEKGKRDCFEHQGISVLVAAMKLHPDSNGTQGLACTTFSELGKDVGLNRDLGRLGAVEATVACLRNRMLWKEYVVAGTALLATESA